jgi:hypothetical protein
MRICGGDWSVLTSSAIKFALIPMMIMSEIICIPLETPKVCSRAPDLRPGIVAALFDSNWEGAGSFSITKGENFHPMGLSDFSFLELAGCFSLNSPDCWLGRGSAIGLAGVGIWSVDLSGFWERKWK